MRAYLLDTTFLIRFLRDDRAAVTWLRKRTTEGDVLACSAINVAEIYAGMRRHEAGATEALLSALRCLPVTFEIARVAGKWRESFRARGRELSLPDAIIGATALIHDAALVTDDRKDFPLPGLRFVTP